MTTTKRFAIHGSMQGLINYILNPNKTDGGLLVTGLNCNPDFAYDQMLMTDRLYQNSGNRVGYHIIQSFSPLDKITHQEANNFGLEMCEKLYPDYQCIVVTHNDTGHIHNHIALHSINLKTGKKLRDSLSSPEGISKLREVSDKMSLEYNLTVIDNAPNINPKRKKQTSSYFYENKNWREHIRNDIDKLLLEADTFEHLLELLKNNGYVIYKRGINYSLRALGMKANIRLSSLGDNYQQNSLTTRIKNKYEIKKIKMVSYNKYSRMYNQRGVRRSNKLSLKIGFYLGRMLAQLLFKDRYYKHTKELNYNFDINRNKIIKSINELSETRRIMKSEDIINEISLPNKFEELNEELILLQNKYSKVQKLNNDYQSLLPAIKVFQEYHSLATLVNEQNFFSKRQFRDSYEKELHDFNYSKNIIHKYSKVETLEDTKKLITKINIHKRETNILLKKLIRLKSRINDLNKVKYSMGLLSDKSSKYFDQVLSKGFSIDIRFVDKDKETDDNYCIRIPKTQEYFYLDKKYSLWISQYSKIYVELLENEYTIFDIKGNDKYKASEKDIKRHFENNDIEQQKIIKNINKNKVYFS